MSVNWIACQNFCYPINPHIFVFDDIIIHINCISFYFTKLTILTLTVQRPLLPSACIAVSTISLHSMHPSTLPSDNVPMQVEMRGDFTDFKTCLGTSEMRNARDLRFARDPCAVLTQCANRFKNRSTLLFLKNWRVKLVMLKERKKIILKSI